jgi:RNA polymerase sigma-70 factor (ECF subfamily)
MPTSAHSISDVTDESLLLRYRDSGDVAAFETLLHRYEKPLFSYLLHYMHSAPLAEEVLQATFLRLHEKCSSFTEDRRVRPWLYSIANHLAIDTMRKEGRHHVASLDQDRTAEVDGAIPIALVNSHTPSPVEEAVLLERARWTRRSVAELPEPLRAIILLMYFQGFTLQEVAETLHLPLGTVKSRLHKALGMLNVAWRCHPESAAGR